LKAFVYTVGTKPTLNDIAEDENSVRSFVKGNYKYIPLWNRLIIVCNTEQTQNPKKEKINRVVTIPEFINGKIAKVVQKAISGNFFVCEHSENGMIDLPHSRIEEVKAICGK
jgi:hypothetical protein